MTRPCTCPACRYAKTVGKARRLFSQGKYTEATYEVIGFLQGELKQYRDHHESAAPAVHAEVAGMVIELARLVHDQKPRPGSPAAVFEGTLPQLEEGSHVPAAR